MNNLNSIFLRHVCLTIVVLILPSIGFPANVHIASLGQAAVSTSDTSRSDTLALEDYITVIDAAQLIEMHNKKMESAVQRSIQIINYAMLFCAVVTIFVALFSIYIPYQQSRKFTSEIENTKELIRSEVDSVNSKYIVELKDVADKASREIKSHLAESSSKLACVNQACEQLIKALNKWALNFEKTTGDKTLSLEAHRIANRFTLHSLSPTERIAALFQLAHLGTDEDLNSIKEISETDPDEDVRKAALKAIEIWEQTHKDENHP